MNIDLNHEIVEGVSLASLYGDEIDEKIRDLPKDASWGKIQAILRSPFKVVRKYWPNGQKSDEWVEKDGQKHGVYRCWNQDGTLDLEFHLKDGKKHGECFVRTSSGGCEISFWKDGKRHGEKFSFSKDGVIKNIVSWKNNQLHGEEKLFIDGQLVLLVTHEDGVPKKKQSWPCNGSPGYNHYYENGEWLPNTPIKE